MQWTKTEVEETEVQSLSHSVNNRARDRTQERDIKPTLLYILHH